ncbi:hypothetical protein [Bremerella alba]|uniref:Uncharacterized protein n=1 Tax=Bremerella alba TaxID=980252 RepID=A0A7V8V2V8_9BACT|nr:hypothetical protein [Bremerella alba]MBA2113923.1 hypothetical protein [Bremerella alba]
MPSSRKVRRAAILEVAVVQVAISDGIVVETTATVIGVVTGIEVATAIGAVIETEVATVIGAVIEAEVVTVIGAAIEAVEDSTQPRCFVAWTKTATERSKATS